MDMKEATIIQTYYDRLTSFSFDERDVFTFLILLRPYSQEGSPVYEFSNFVAHREKDRGHIYEYLLASKSFFNKIGIKLGQTHELKSVFSEKDIHDSFDTVLTGLGLAPISSEVCYAVQLCIISLLQDVKISDKTGTAIGKLLFAFDKENIYLMGLFSVVDFPPYSHLQVPVLTMKNQWLKTESYELQTPGIVEISRTHDEIKVRIWQGVAATAGLK
jgi:hypothetical protein